MKIPRTWKKFFILALYVTVNPGRRKQDRRSRKKGREKRRGGRGGRGRTRGTEKDVCEEQEEEAAHE